MNAQLKNTWIQRCAQRIAELRPQLRPSLATLVAVELWQDVRGHVPPEEWAEIEVGTWGEQQGAPNG
ncbi:MAG: hypothetical protein C0487_02865 [Leptothrix sp. (in: Bacteria)]|nr:hypothetical protein [Leptothrix sp. (in: b-proteobacteria)]